MVSGLHLYLSLLLLYIPNGSPSSFLFPGHLIKTFDHSIMTFTPHDISQCLNQMATGPNSMASGHKGMVFAHCKIAFSPDFMARCHSFMRSGHYGMAVTRNYMPIGFTCR